MYFVHYLNFILFHLEIDISFSQKKLEEGYKHYDQNFHSTLCGAEFSLYLWGAVKNEKSERKHKLLFIKKNFHLQID